MGNYYGYPTLVLKSTALELECLQTAGPRIVRLSYQGSANLLAEVPSLARLTPFGNYHFLGGHRLWHSPEDFPRSYIPDLDGLTVQESAAGFVLEGKTEQSTGIRKRIEICLDPVQPAVTLVHTLVNENPWEVELAPWAITMFRLGGTMIMPILGGDPGKDGLLPDRHIAFWSYSRVSDPRLTLDDQFILLRAEPNQPPFKLGAWNPSGWLAYWVDGLLFRKTFEVHASSPYPDFGCNSESYCDQYMVELESLGPLTRLAPGGNCTHVETWQVFDSVEQDFIPSGIASLLRS